MMVFVEPIIIVNGGTTVFVSDLFNGAVSSSDYIASRIIHDQWIGKNVEGSGRGLI
jgi:hypothetical protein